MRLLGVAVLGFGISKKTAGECVLRSETVRRGLSGERCTQRWCCALTGFVEHLLERELIQLPAEMTEGFSKHVALFMPLATEMIWWDLLRKHDKGADALAHFRYFVVGAAHRLGALLGAHTVAVPGFVASGAWANPERRAEPLRIMFALAGGPSTKLAAKQIGYDEDTLRLWLGRGRAPSVAAIDDLARWVGRIVPVLPEVQARKWLRWHYALAFVGDRLADALGREAVMEAANVFVRLATCVASNAQERVASGEVQSGAGLALFLRSTQSTLAIDVMLNNLDRHGASPTFIADVAAAHSAWRAAVPISGVAPKDIDVALLLRHLPRLRPGERRRRRPRRSGVRALRP